ncbi:glycosyltransferase family 4 protein [Marinobacterium arenosum]|uniref:glycosyltransferase family 4 protein n=1 Tax=Marinobacterium arenosum TaxID=2862496 RepID=UPI001C95DF63|nr:glycosyltransferase family 1 protein [Marinobacterium arenosum]MBY4676796.1 glycosyltransferase family 4 protein [Marinobacterium arenosum]
MKIITNVASLMPPLTGIGHYTRELLSFLLTHPEVEDIRGMSPVKWYEREQLATLLEPDSSCAGSDSEPAKRLLRQSIRGQLVKVARRVPFARRAKQLLAERTARRRAAECDGYLYWEPNYLLLPVSNPAITTVHDLSHMVYPQFHPAERVKLLDQQLGNSLRQAKRVVAVSEYTRLQIEQAFDIPAAEIALVPPAVGDPFRLPHSTEALAGARQRYGLPDQYVLSVGTLEPRKNVEGLIQAYAALPAALRQGFPLVLVGAKGWMTEKLEALLAPMLKRGEVIRLGYVAQQDLPLIYAAASCMGYVSYFEGFGMPIAEAMASGTAVITSNTSSMPEVAGGAARLVDPSDCDDISQALLTVLEDDRLRREMEQRGRDIASQYTWQRSGETLLTEFKRLAQA